MTEENENVITIDGTDYKSSDLNDDQKYLVEQIKDCQIRTKQAKMNFDREHLALSAFLNSLVKSFEKKVDEAEVLAS